MSAAQAGETPGRRPWLIHTGDGPGWTQPQPPEPEAADPPRTAGRRGDVAAPRLSDTQAPDGQAAAACEDIATRATDRRDEARQAARARYDAAVREAWAGISPDQDTRAAWRQADPGLQEAQRRLDRDLGAAVCQPDGQRHPDAFLAARGWQAEGGVWVHRQAAPGIDREAG